MTLTCDPDHRGFQWSNHLVIHLLLIILTVGPQITSGSKVPTFNPPEAVVSFSEEAVIGTRRLLEPANIDSPDKIVSYQIEDDSSSPQTPFRIHETRSQDGNDIAYIHLETRQKLDREAKSRYRLKVSAVSRTGEKGFLNLDVEVLDVNDNPPVFEDSEYRVTVNDSLEIGDTIVQTVAKDADEGKNAKIEYHLPEEFANHFDLDSETGWIRTKSALKCSQEDPKPELCLPCLRDSRVCSILVVATDGGQPRQSAQTVVKINLVDSNDHPPEISFRYLPDQSRPYAAVEVGAEAGSSVAAVTITDQDQGKHGQTNVEIISGNSKNHFRLESYGGSLSVIRVAPGARFVPGERYNLTLRASDLGTPPKISSASLSIVVNEGNEHPPVFDVEEYEVSLAEDVPVGSSVVAVRATDKDDAARIGMRAGRHLNYNISEGNNPDWFQIHPLSGLITTRAQLDRELREGFNLIVTVTDGGVRPRTSSAKVLIKLSDVNDVSPEFEKSVYQVSLSENFAANATFYTVKAIDQDSGNNGVVTYSLASHNNIFRIDASSGELSTVGNLDREKFDEFNVKVVATDGGNPKSRSSTAVVQIQVSDENDNSPQFYPRLYFVTLPTKRAANTSPLVTVVAHDTDDGDNAKLTYAIEKSEGQSVRLDENTGDLYLERLVISDGVIQISALDGGGRKSKEFAQVKIFANKTAGVFTSPSFNFTITEDDDRISEATLHRQIGYVSLNMETLRGKFDILDGDGLGIFDIDPDTGLISTQKQVDREKQSEFNLRVAVAILGTKTYSECQVQIIIEDVNDVTPSFFTDEPEVIEASGDAAIGQPLHRIGYEDADLGKNGEVRFKLEDPSGYFAMDPEEGILNVRKSLADVKSGNEFQIKVTMTDQGEPALSAMQSYTIRVLRGNVHTPVFDFDNNEITVSESASLNTEIITLAALDLDEGDNGEVLYSIADGDTDKFGIFPDGRVYLKDYLDRELKAYYAITVRATDKGNPVRSSTSTVVVYVSDENDNSPLKISSSSDVLYVDENVQPFTVVGRVTASDADVGRNAELTYSFGNGQTTDNFLRVDPRTGFISTEFQVDREALIRDLGRDSFQLDVSISDNGIFRRTTPVAVNVIVVDKNDNAPEFSELFYDGSISEGTKVGSDILTVHAKDIDKDTNGDITYSFKNGSSNHPFKIEPATGLVTLTDKLDRETVDRYVLTIIATDGGTPEPLVGEAQLKIRVLDENDEKPTFSSNQLSLPLSEGTKIGTAVHRFQAVDRDLGHNARLKYSLGGGDYRNFFHLDSNTGLFSLTGSLDRETKDVIRLTVTAVDGGSPQLTGSIAVTITVQDINDNPPVFPTTAILASVRENLPIGTKIRRIVATDQDLGDSGKVEYGLKGTDDFRIDPDSGDLFTNTKLDRETKESYAVIVVATDKGTPRLSTEKSITVVVEDENDNTPEITSLNAALILPGTPKGTTIMSLKAIDEDGSSNGIVTFRWGGEGSPEIRGPYSLDQHSGQVIITRNIDTPDRDVVRLTVIASDDAVPSVRRSATATVLIVPGREKPGPSFTTDLYRSTIKENSPVGTLVGTVALGVTDETASFFIVGCDSERGRERGIFSIDPVTGQIRTSRKIDRETEGNKITLQIVALVGDDTMSGCKMEVSCVDENDSPPVFDESLNFVLSEAFLPGHRLAKVKATDRDLDSVINYSLSLATQSFMEIHAQTGELTLTQTLNREEYSSIEVVIYASDGVQTSEWKRRIEVEDINDNAPVFATPTFSFDILENAERGAIVGRIEATDSDHGSAASQISYTLIPDRGLDTFSLDPTSGVVTLSGNSLDHEDTQHYILIVSASDAGDPPLTATATVYVNVKDVNDNPPDIERNLYEINIQEDVQLQTSILQIKVTDKDSDENTLFAFTIDDSVNDVFDISSNGTITTKKSLDRETLGFYAFQVMVTDHIDSYQQLTSTCSIQITVTDVNDERPMFEAISKLTIAENSPPNTPIATVRAFDKDSGKNAELEYIIEDSQMGKFSIGRTDGVLRCVQSLDREQKSEYSLSVTAIDGGSPRLSSRVDVTVQILDVNDNTPEFSQKFYSASVFENASIGMDLLHVTAIDKDSDENGRLRFSILSGDKRGDFSIGETSGIVRVNKQLDYERRNNYELTLQVEDGGDPGRYDTSSVTILILDSNDNAPTFEHSPYFLKVMEHSQLSATPFFTVRARDRDDAPFNDVEYSIRAGGRHDNYFTLNTTTGDIYINGPIDREEISELTLELLALDSGTPRLTGTGTLYVTVEDINDHAPAFETDSYFFSTFENVEIGQNIDRVLAYDQDVGLNAKIRYSLKGTDAFIIDENSGVISTRLDLDRETADKHVFTVLAKDSSQFRPLTGSATVTVKVTDVNDNRPEFDATSTDFYIPPGVKQGDFILGVSAWDSDEEENARLKFSIGGKDSKNFVMNSKNGVVTASQNFKEKSNYDVTVEVQDEGSPNLKREARFSVYFAEELVVPRFDDSATPPQINLFEDLPVGESVVNFKAIPVNGEDVNYGIAGGNLGRTFDVDQQTGRVFVNQSLDFETVPRFELWVKAFYKNKPLFFVSKKVVIEIADKNDNVPVFERPLVKVSIPEGQLPPFDVAELFATDADLGANGEVTYEILGYLPDQDQGQLFRVDPESGLVRCFRELDREKLDRYTIKIGAFDKGTPRQSSIATVLLNVADVNDNPPRFARLYSVNITESVAVGTELVYVDTIDQDGPENSNVTYAFVENPDDAFDIEPVSGKISVAKSLDREIRDEYSLRIRADDGAWKLETVITITLVDDNDNAPVFDRDLYEFSVPYAKNNISVVGRVQALDRDAQGPNSAVSYSLAYLHDFFKVDESSGTITTRKDLEFHGSSSDNTYRIRIIATDAGSPPMSSECEVAVTVVGGNDHAPKIQIPEGETEAKIAVPAGLETNTLVYGISASDLDSNFLLYGFSGGNGSEFFKIDPDSGKISTSKSLTSLQAATVLVLEVTVSDGGIPNRTDTVTVLLTVTADNLHAPEFQSPATRIYIREDEQIGNAIVNVKATDADEGINGQVEYAIVKGDPENRFEIDKVSGAIVVKAELDYEKIPVYNLVVRAKDRGFYSMSATSGVKIILQDVDDNSPTFDKSEYEATLKENSDPGTEVTQMIATDLDSPKNAKIEYELINRKDEFSLDPLSGVVFSKVAFDYEQTEQVDLKVRAKNPSNPSVFAETTLHVFIEGENEFLPKFRQPVFQFAVSESAQIGDMVGQVEAPDNDQGKDGDVFYYIIGFGSGFGSGFGVDRNTGVIHVRDSLDRESQNRYVLTVLAKNRGSIRGNDTDEAQVIIQVQDGNDPPVFRKPLYTAKVSEGANVGTNVITVSAVDKDVRPRNSQFSYSLHDGNIENKFSVDPNSGIIVVDKSLDREDVPFYNLTVRAVDNGSPPAIGETHVHIIVEDVNDSPPSLPDRKAYVKENNPPGSIVKQFVPVDPDPDPNGGPFTFTLMPGKNGDLFALDATTGVLNTAALLDREQNPTLEITIRIEDAGLPKLAAEFDVVVEVGDENDNPSMPRSVNVIIKNYEGTFPGGEVMFVRPSDLDIIGDYHCELIEGPEAIFNVDKECVVRAGRIQNGREYDLKILTNDGKHSDVEVKARLNFVSFSEFAVRESVAVRFSGATVSEVLGFFEQLRTSHENRLLELLSLNPKNETVECFFASRENNIFLPKSDTLNHLREISNELDTTFAGAKIIYDFDPCSEGPCQNGGKCSSRVSIVKKSEIAESGDTIFNSPSFIQNITCNCPNEFGGDRCEKQKNPCLPNPCQEGGQCLLEGETFHCLCPSLRGGRTCELQKSNVCNPNPCLNGGSCQNTKANGFFCLCRPGYQGDNCQDVIDTCRQNPCLNGGTCVSLKPNYRCRCHDHFYGNHCELSTFGFAELSYTAFPPLDSNTNDISVTFATSKPNSLLVYNYGKAAGGRSDFLALELVSGKPRLSWGGGRTAITSLELPKQVDTGRWYKVTATRNNRVGSLSVEDCTESGEFCKTCLPDDERCFAKEVGESGTLVFNDNYMYFGGIPDETAILDRPGQLSTVDFVGCIKSISINGNDKNLIKESLNRTGLTNTCNKADGGACSRGDECGPTGTCIPLWSYHKCRCAPGDILAPNCGDSFEPITLTETQEVHFKPSKKYRQTVRLGRVSNLLNRWRRDVSNAEPHLSLALAFRTLKKDGPLLSAESRGGTYTRLQISEGVLVYKSLGGLGGKSEINMTSGIDVADGSWHNVKLEVMANILRFYLDEQRVGYEVEFSAAHNFLDPELEKIVIGDAKQHSEGFRGCIANFTLNDELQSAREGNGQLLEMDLPAGVQLNGCDVDVLRVVQSKSAVDVGVTVVIVFFVLLLCAIAASFTFFKLRRKMAKQKASREDLNQKEHQANVGGHVNRSLELESGLVRLNNQQPTTPKPRPDIIDGEGLGRRGIGVGAPLTRLDPDPMFSHEAEHYDLENASSIAPSDIDIVYHYKGYRRGGRSLPKKKRNQMMMQNTPLARLSPSSEISHNTPRILTLGDLSGKRLPPGLMAEQSERSLNSPVSHVSSGSRHSRHHRRHNPGGGGGLTSENVARFNSGNASPARYHLANVNSSTLVNTLDLVSVGSESRKKSNFNENGNNNNTLGAKDQLDLHSSSSSDTGDDSFTCSEFECESNSGGVHAQGTKDLSDASAGHAGSGGMVFNKLAANNTRQRRPRHFPDSDDEIDDDDDLRVMRSRPDSAVSGGRSWEHLLAWWPDYDSFAGVFKDIAELPHTTLASELDQCRPSPLGDRQPEEEYI